MKAFSLHLHNGTHFFHRAQIMGILNLTPDSFYDGGRYLQEADALRQTEKMLTEGARFIDIGAVSSRPSAAVIEESEELNRLIPILKALRREFPEAWFSIDTFRAEVARQALMEGADIINDIYGGQKEPEILRHCAQFQAPIILMHMQGEPANMQQNPQYEHLLKEVYAFLHQARQKAISAGINDILIDPGFGFGKSLDHNYRLLAGLNHFHSIGAPILLGFSRKSMITKLLNIKTIDAVNGTTVLNTIGLLKGAAILRVHDVKEAVQARQITEAMQAQREEIENGLD